MRTRLRRLWIQTRGQGVAEYAVMLAVVLTVMVGIIQLVAVHARDIFAHVASTLR